MFLLHHKKNQVRKPPAAKRTNTFDERYMGHIPYQRDDGDDLTSVDQAMEAHLLFPEQAKVETPSDILWMPPSYDHVMHNARMNFI